MGITSHKELKQFRLSNWHCQDLTEGWFGGMISGMDIIDKILGRGVEEIIEREHLEMRLRAEINFALNLDRSDGAGCIWGTVV